jgi:hypothetical protein
MAISIPIPFALPVRLNESQLADRAKGTLQIKVQIVDPDKFLTPELSARVDFLKSR